jgi:transcription elongation factor Elf1
LAIAPPAIDLDTFAVSDQCGFCDYFSDKKDRMRRHIRTVHLREKPFHCDLCPLAFGRKDKLKRHVDTVHSVDKPFKCDFCAHASGRRDKLKYHVETAHLRMRPDARPPKKFDAELVQ